MKKDDFVETYELLLRLSYSLSRDKQLNMPADTVACLLQDAARLLADAARELRIESLYTGMACPVCGEVGRPECALYHVSEVAADFVPMPVEGWSEADCRAAMTEGWGIFYSVDAEALEIQRLDSLEILESDDDALKLVMRAAAAGSPMHKQALAVVGISEEGN